MTTLQEAARKALACLELYDYVDLASCEARHELRTALAQQGEQPPVCHGCGIPAGDVHMSTCKSGKWPSRVSNGDTAAPAPQTPFNEPDAAMWLTKNKLAQHDLLSAPQPNIQNQIVKDISKKPCHK